MTMLTDNPKLGRRLQASLIMKQRALAYMEAIMTDDPPPSVIFGYERLVKEIARIEDLMR